MTEHGHTSMGRTSASVRTSVPVGELAAVVEAALTNQPQFTVISSSAFGMELSRRTNWATWGEKVRLSWSPLAEGSVVQIQIVPRVTTTVVDWGQGRRDLKQLEKILARATTTRR